MTYRMFPEYSNVPWKTVNGIVHDQLDLTRWNLIFDKRTSGTILAYGGLLESYLSLAYIDLYSKTLPKLKLTWAGNSKYQELIKYNSLNRFIDDNLFHLTKECQLPFFTKGDELYLNSLYSFHKYYDKDGIYKYENTTPVSQQIYKNTHLQQKLTVPKLPMFEPSQHVQMWIQSNKFNTKIPFYLIIPDTVFSNHVPLIKKWDKNKYRQLCSLLKLNGHQVVLLTNNYNKYIDLGVKLVEPNLDILIYLLMNKPLGVITESIDVAIVAGCLSNTKLISNKIPFNLNLKQNLKHFGLKREILQTRRYINPMRAYKFLTGTK